MVGGELRLAVCSAAAKSAGRMMELECSGASLCQSSSSKPWIKVLLRIAAAKGPIFCGNFEVKADLFAVHSRNVLVRSHI